MKFYRLKKAQTEKLEKIIGVLTDEENEDWLYFLPRTANILNTPIVFKETRGNVNTREVVYDVEQDRYDNLYKAFSIEVQELASLVKNKVNVEKKVGDLKTSEKLKSSEISALKSELKEMQLKKNTLKNEQKRNKPGGFTNYIADESPSGFKLFLLLFVRKKAIAEAKRFVNNFKENKKIISELDKSISEKRNLIRTVALVKKDLGEKIKELNKQLKKIEKVEGEVPQLIKYVELMRKIRAENKEQNRELIEPDLAKDQNKDDYEDELQFHMEM